MKYRQGIFSDVEQLRLIALKSWDQFRNDLLPEHWEKLFNSLNSKETFTDLLDKSSCIVCENDNEEIVGMAFLVPSGNPTDIYLTEWSYIRFVTVDPEYGGRGIGRRLTELCIDKAKENSETTIALHTSEMMHKARHIYESMGFKVLRELEPRLGKKYWLYTLDIS